MTAHPSSLIHGSLATGADEWSAQSAARRRMASRLIVPRPARLRTQPGGRRRGLPGRRRRSRHLMSHRGPPRRSLLRRLVSHDRRRPPSRSDFSLHAARTAVASMAQHDPAWRTLVPTTYGSSGTRPGRPEWVVRSSKRLAATRSVPRKTYSRGRRARPRVPLRPAVLRRRAALRRARVRHVPQARRFGAPRRLRGNERRARHSHRRVREVVIPGAGHEIQFTGAPINETLRSLWSSTSTTIPERLHQRDQSQRVHR